MKFIMLFLISVFGMLLTTARIVTRPRTKYMEEGETGLIALCSHLEVNENTGEETAIFVGDIKWFWVNDTSMIHLSVSSNVRSTGYALTTVNVQVENSGNYCCVVGEAESCTRNATTQLIVVVTPQLVINNSMVTATDGQSVQLTCTHANPDGRTSIRVQWYHNKSLLFAGEKYTISTTEQAHSYSLHIYNVTQDDIGTYSCKANSQYSSRSAETFYLTVLPMITTSRSPVTSSTVEPFSNLSTMQPSSGITTTLNTGIIRTKVTLPPNIICASIEKTAVDEDLRTSLAMLCSCQGIAVIGTTFECINNSHADYNFLIIGSEAFEAAAVLSYSLSNENYWISQMGSHLRLNAARITTLLPNRDKDSEANTCSMQFEIYIPLTIIIFALGLVMGLLIGLFAYCWRIWAENPKSLCNTDSNQHQYEEIHFNNNLHPSYMHSTMV